MHHLMLLVSTLKQLKLRHPKIQLTYNLLISSSSFRVTELIQKGQLSLHLSMPSAETV